MVLLLLVDCCFNSHTYCEVLSNSLITGIISCHIMSYLVKLKLVNSSCKSLFFIQVILPHCSISTLTTTTEWMLSCIFAAPSGGHTEHYTLDKDDGTYVVEYTPKQAGMYF